MKKFNLVVILGLLGIVGHLYGMEESIEKAKISNDVTITLKDAEVAISAEQFEGFKEIVPSEIKIMLEAGAPYSLHSVNEIGFDFIIKHVELIKNKDSEALKGEFKKLYKADTIDVFIGTLDTAAYLVIDEVLKVASEFINENALSMILCMPQFLEALLELSQKKHKQTRFFDLNRQSEIGNTALIWAARKGRKEIVEMLVNAKANLNTQGGEGETALLSAVLGSYKEIVEMLIKAGADLNIRNEIGETALIMAAYFGRKEIVEVLINAKADLDIQANKGLTALMWAARNGYKEIVEMLIKAKADLNIVDNYYSTALMWAAEEGHDEIIKLLKEAGADLHKRNDYGDIAFMMATKKGHKEIVELLKEALLNQKMNK